MQWGGWRNISRQDAIAVSGSWLRHWSLHTPSSDKSAEVSNEHSVSIIHPSQKFLQYQKHLKGNRHAETLASTL